MSLGEERANKLVLSSSSVDIMRWVDGRHRPWVMVDQCRLCLVPL